MTTQTGVPAAHPAVALYDRAMRFLAGSSMAIITVVMLVQVIARYIFNASLIWAEELCRYILIWQTFLFISMAFRQGELVAVDILTNLMPRKAVYAMRLLVAAPIVAFLALMVKYGYDFASRFTKQTIPAIDFIWTSLTGGPAGLTVIWIYISVSVGMALLLMHFVISLYVDGKALFFPHEDREAGRAAS
ncbi:MAG: TRAP transporter small permease [Methylobacteriaceae bacterium]|nr:TRAP transporter small permease [Methylobacteriaceae bacterium]